jgi:acyl-CoA reductase-like NAD-dependent aldehyde dehydrogenase
MNTDIRLESRIYVNGRWQEGQGGRRQVISPTTGQPFAEVTEATEAQLQEAISAARSALPHWSARSPQDRAP